MNLVADASGMGSAGWASRTARLVFGWIFTASLALFSQAISVVDALGNPVEASPPTAADMPIYDMGLDRFAEPKLASNGTTFLQAC